jgi:hypothetical protein
LLFQWQRFQPVDLNWNKSFSDQAGFDSSTNGQKCKVRQTNIVGFTYTITIP